MGVQQTVQFEKVDVPSWTVVQQLLRERGYPVEMRMIDGALAFPDEAPAEPWGELRLGTPEGMITVRRLGNSLTFVAWGNAEGPMLRAWNALTWAFAEAGAGEIQCSETTMTATQFKQCADLPPTFRDG